MKMETAWRLHEAVAACEELVAMCAGRSRSAIHADRMLQLASRKLIEIVGEALHQAEASEPAILESVVDLREIVDTRNRIVHGYNTINYNLLWDIIHDELPPLIALLNGLLRDAPDIDGPVRI